MMDVLFIISRNLTGDLMLTLYLKTYGMIFLDQFEYLIFSNRITVRIDNYAHTLKNYFN